MILKCIYSDDNNNKKKKRNAKAYSHVTCGVCISTCPLSDTTLSQKALHFKTGKG